MIMSSHNQRQTETVTVSHTDWQQIRQQLEEKRNEIVAKIRNYPPPITACDAQFNHLLEQRTAIRQELRRADTIQQQRVTSDDAQARLAEFIKSSQFLEETFAVSGQIVKQK